MKNRKQIIIPLIFVIVIGGSLISNSELKNTRLVDIVQLVVLGIFLGVLIYNLKMIFGKKN